MYIFYLYHHTTTEAAKSTIPLFLCPLHPQYQHNAHQTGNHMKASRLQHRLWSFQRSRSHHDCIKRTDHHSKDGIDCLHTETLQTNLDPLYYSHCTYKHTASKKYQTRKIGQLQGQHAFYRCDDRNVSSKNQKQRGTGNPRQKHRRNCNHSNKKQLDTCLA